ncbi:MAG: ABC transporter substrate-binding protein [Roseobacter sp.]
MTNSALITMKTILNSFLSCVKIDARTIYVCPQNFQVFLLILVQVTFLAVPDPVAADPRRVVSINLCTDQLALMLTPREHLISVSRLSHDPENSVLYDAARSVPANGSTAEEVYLLSPDLVLAGTYTSIATVNMLRNLGIQVELFAPTRSLSDVGDRIIQMGNVLGQRQTAAHMVAEFETKLATLSDAPKSERFRAALTYVNNFSSGDATLAGDILSAAGFDNAASEIGLSSVGVLSLEELIFLAPDVIIPGRNYPGVARAESNLSHPALHALAASRLANGLTTRDWICGTPHVINALEDVRRLRLEMERTE